MDETREEAALYLLAFDTDVHPESGEKVSAPGIAVNLLPFPVQPGCRLLPARPGVRFKVHFYLPEIPPELIHTYTYQAEANWTTYCPERSTHEWGDWERVLSWVGFVRVAVSLAPDSGSQMDAASLTDYVRIEQPEHGERTVPEWMNECREDLLKRVAALRQKDDLVLMLLSDTHYAVGGIWPDTLQSLRLVADDLHPDAVVHLGDFTDGLLPSQYTKSLSKSMLSELRGLCGRLWCCVGNHDRNYFRGNTSALSRKECSQLYLGRNTPWYHVDLPDRKLRLLFLDSFDPGEKERYGFPKAEVLWVGKTLRKTPKGYRVLVFSHVPPTAELHVWSPTIRNERWMLHALERFHRRRKGAVLGWIHGHCHADQVYRKRKFPVVGVGCSKLEDFLEHKPAGSVTYPRAQHSATQELWDVLLVHTQGEGLDFLRFGAGEDRHVEAGRQQ